jgi:hypothetical protein
LGHFLSSLASLLSSLSIGLRLGRRWQSWPVGKE